MAKNKKASFNLPSDNPLQPKITLPSSPTYHGIEDGCLETIVKLNSPLSSLISVGCFGYVLGEFIEILKLISNAYLSKEFSIDWIDLVSLSIFSIALSVAVCTLIYSRFCKNDAKRILEEIRSRPSKDIKNSEP